MIQNLHLATLDPGYKPVSQPSVLGPIHPPGPAALAKSNSASARLRANPQDLVDTLQQTHTCSFTPS